MVGSTGKACGRSERKDTGEKKRNVITLGREKGEGEKSKKRGVQWGGEREER